MEVIGGVADMIPPVEIEPADVFDDGLHVLGLLLDRIGVIEAQVTGTPIFLRKSKIQADRFGVADMQIAVGLGREACLNAAIPLSTLHIIMDDLLNEVS